jgi:hypothetical protein
MEIFYWSCGVSIGARQSLRVHRISRRPAIQRFCHTRFGRIVMAAGYVRSSGLRLEFIPKRCTDLLAFGTDACTFARDHRL